MRKLKEEGISLETDTVITESPDEKFLTYITEVIEQNLSNSDLNVTRLSELSGYHSKQIYRRVKQLTGYTTVEYIKGIRMKKAAMLLAKKQFMIRKSCIWSAFPTLLISPNALWRNTEKLPDNTWKICKDGLLSEKYPWLSISFCLFSFCFAIRSFSPLRGSYLGIPL